jgi:hypothetical protein
MNIENDFVGIARFKATFESHSHISIPSSFDSIYFHEYE